MTRKSEHGTYESAVQAFLREMAHIEGSPEAYRQGLRDAIAEIQTEILASEECSNADDSDEELER